jgi:dTDP-glucose pyrophosphorylase
MNIVIPMAGVGKRFSSFSEFIPKPLIEINGKSMIECALSSLAISSKNNNFIFITRDYKSNNLNSKLDNILKSFSPSSIVIKIDYITDGPASTCLLSKEFINNEDNLMICNCDQIMRWNGDYFLNSCVYSDYDGVLVTYDSSTPKNSYAKIDFNGNVVKVEEKKVISNISLNGIHFWKKGKYFIESAEEMIDKRDMSNNEFYVGPTYNYMIKNGKKVGIFHIAKEQHWPTGTPEDLEKYINFLEEENKK